MRKIRTVKNKNTSSKNAATTEERFNVFTETPTFFIPLPPKKENKKGAARTDLAAQDGDRCRASLFYSLQGIFRPFTKDMQAREEMLQSRFPFVHSHIPR